jgi:hypothetical protein
MNTILLAALWMIPILGRADIAQEIRSKLSPFEVLRGHFEQTKSIPILKKPLKSRGDFVLLKGKGVLWNTSYPVASMLRVTPGEIAQLKDGKVSFRMKAEEQPVLKLVGQVLFAVFAADVDELKRHFEISGTMQGGHWEALLLPKEAWVAKVAKEIRLSGSQSLETLQISESNGDKSSIRFSKVLLNTSLSVQEKALFE